MNICIVDDHPLVLKAISSILATQGHRVEVAQDIREATSLLCENGRFDLLLLDYHLASGKGTELLRQPSFPIPAHVIILSAMTDPEEILDALEQTSAKAFVSKAIALDDLPAAVDQLVSGRKKMTDSCIWDIDRRCFLDVRVAFPKDSVLTPSERKVFMLLRKGLQDKQIAEQIHRSIHTVRVQIRSIRRKRGQCRRAEVEL